MAFFPRFQEVSPFFHLLNEVERSFPTKSVCVPAARSYAPRVNVSEEPLQYVVQAEVPGFEQDDISVEWTDAGTLTISGRVQAKVDAVNPTKEPSQSAQPVDSTDESRPKLPTVEDAEDEDAPSTPTSTSHQALTPATTVSGEQPLQPQALHDARQPKFWVKERSLGQFSRSFTFSNRIDHDNVKAILKNGILNISVPKAPPHQVTRVQVE